MPLPLLVVIVVVGIAAVVFAVHMTGGSRSVTLRDEAAARERFAVDHPEIAVTRVWLTADRTAAVLDLGGGTAGLVHAIGGKFLTRIVGAEDLAGAPRASGDRLALRLRDFTWPGAVLNFDRSDDASAVEALFARQRSLDLWKES
jgi:hypothetical protein